MVSTMTEILETATGNPGNIAEGESERVAVLREKEGQSEFPEPTCSRIPG